MADVEQAAPDVSVVVAVRNFRHTLRECLNQLALQARSRNVEIIVVDASTDGSAQIVSEFSPRIKRLTADPQSLVPQLWSLGIDTQPRSYAFEFWWAYTLACRALAAATRLSMREVDRALWQYSKERQG